MINIILILLLSYAAVMDHKTGCIPDHVHIFILLTGVYKMVTYAVAYSNNFVTASALTNFILSRVVGLILPVILCLILWKVLSEDALGGGDMKLFASLGFSVGVKCLFRILFVAYLIAFFYVKFKKDEKSIPMAVPTFAAAFLIFL